MKGGSYMFMSDFIQQLNKLENSKSIKSKFIDERITRIYVPINEKREGTKDILNKSIIEENNIKYVDTILNEIMFICYMLYSYTDLDCTGDVFEMYDAIKSNHIDEEILPRIGNDLLEYRYILIHG